jgi:hypothetical protein
VKKIFGIKERNDGRIKVDIGIWRGLLDICGVFGLIIGFIKK